MIDVYCTVLYCTVPYCIVFIVLYCTYCTVLYCTVLYCSVLYCTVLYCTVLYCTVLYCTVPYCIVFTVLYCTYCTVLYCTVLYCTVLYATVTLGPPAINWRATFPAGLRRRREHRVGTDRRWWYGWDGQSSLQRARQEQEGLPRGALAGRSAGDERCGSLGLCTQRQYCRDLHHRQPKARI